ncbi:MAG: hypothetical protein R3F59_04295 [Myxococcota bacterium]
MMLTTLLLSTAAHATPVDREDVSVHTAHVLPWGEVMFGTSGLHAGILPHVQIGVRPWLTALGLPSGTVRVGVVDTRWLDVAVNGHGTFDTFAGTRLSAVGGGATASVEAGRFGLHTGLSHTWVHAEGIPTRSPWWLPTGGGGDPLATASTDPGMSGVVPVLHGGTTSLRGAGDVHVAGPLSLLVQGVRTWSTLGASVEGQLPAEVASLAPAVDLHGLWTVSGSMVLSLGRLQLRGGAGASSVPYAWIPQANAAHLRLGGKSAKRMELQGIDSDGIADL